MLFFVIGAALAPVLDVAARLGEYVDVDPTVVFPQLQSARFNPSTLSAYDLLRRDYRDAVEALYLNMVAGLVGASHTKEKACFTPA